MSLRGEILPLHLLLLLLLLAKKKVNGYGIQVEWTIVIRIRNEINGIPIL